MTMQTLSPRARRARSDVPAVVRPSPMLFGCVSRYFEGYVRRHFHAVRMLSAPPRPPTPPGLGEVPTIVYLNHASWWDPLACFVLARRFFAKRSHYAPMDAVALGKYGFLRKLGMFPLDPSSRAGAAHFLRTASGLLEQPGAMLWITPEGRFTDARTRPTAIRPGLAHLARQAPRAAIVPLAIEYTFWNERLPELLLTFGPRVELPRGLSASAATGVLAEALEAAQDRLAEAARTRDPQRFRTLLQGRGGVHPVYDRFRRLGAALRGKRVSTDHEGALGGGAG